MASRGAPDLTGYGPRALSLCVVQEESQCSLEVVSADTGRRMVGGERGVDHESQRQVSHGQPPAMEACPKTSVQREWKGRGLLPSTAVESTMVSAPDEIPKEAPAMEAWIHESDAAGTASMKEDAASEVLMSSEHGDSAETVGDDEVSAVANSADVPEEKASDYAFDTGATKHVTGDVSSLDAVEASGKALKFRSASGDIERAERKGTKGSVGGIHVLPEWQSMISVGTLCDNNEYVFVINADSGYVIQKGKGVAPIIRDHGVRVAQRNVATGGLYKCTPALFGEHEEGGEQCNASEGVMVQDVEAKVGAGCAPVDSEMTEWKEHMGSWWFEMYNAEVARQFEVEREYHEAAMAATSIAQRRMLPGQEHANPATLFHEATGHPSRELMKWIVDHPEVVAVEVTYTKEDVDKMGPHCGCLNGADDVELENEMPEKGGPDLPECQGGAG